MVTPQTTGAYVRVSTEKQAIQTSPGRQRDENQKWMRETFGFSIPQTNVFEEPGRTGASLSERPVMQQVLHLIETKQLRTVVFNTLDRAARNLDVLFRIRWVFLEADAHGFCVHEKLEITTTDFQELVGFLVHGLKAQMELDDLVRRMLGGRETRVAQGEAASGGIVPFGFDRVRIEMPDGHMGVFFDINPDEKGVCHMIWACFVEEKMGRLQIARHLNDLGIPSASASPARRQKPGQWWPGFVGKILTYPTYRGEYRWGKYAISIPRIYSELDAWRIDKQVDENRKHRRYERKYRYLLAGLLRCSGCKHAYTGSTTMYKGRPFGYYRCTARRGTILDKGCKAPTLRVPETEHAVWENVKALVQNPQALEDLANYQRQAIEQGVGLELDAIEDKITRIKKDQEGLTLMIARLMRDQQTGKQVDQKLDRAQKVLDDKDRELEGLLTLQAQYQNRQRQKELQDQELHYTQERISQWRAMIKDTNLPFELQREIVRGITGKITVSDHGALMPDYSLFEIPTLIDNSSVLTLESALTGKIGGVIKLPATAILRH